jgi:ketosteroid isomerase-like protein
MEDVVITRVRYSERPRPSRNLEERLMVRFPSLFRRLAARVFQLSPGSRLRRAVLRRALLSGWASFDRRDLAVNAMFFAPDVEFEFPAGMQTLGLSGSFRGRRIDALGRIFEVWDATESEPAYLLDLGDRVLNLGFWRGKARASGIPLETEFAQLATVRDGAVVRDQNFFSWAEGLQAAGLEPDAIALQR